MAGKKRTRGVLLQFPSLPGNPEDPDLPAISEALRNVNPYVTDAECRAFAREFAKARDHLNRESRGLSRDQRSAYVVTRIIETLIDIDLQDGASEEEATDFALQAIERIAAQVGEHHASLA
jgi:hypothetical protein